MNALSTAPGSASLKPKNVIVATACTALSDCSAGSSAGSGAGSSAKGL